MRTNDIFTAYLAWNGGGKRRPVYVIDDNEKEVIFYKITTKYKKKSSSIQQMYFPIQDWKMCGLFRPSYIDTITVNIIDKSKVHLEYVGHLSSRDVIRLSEFLALQ